MWLVVSGIRLEIVQPSHNIIFVLPVDQCIYFRILRDVRLDILDKPVLDFPSFRQIQLQVDHGGLDIFMSQFISDIRDRVAVCEHVHGAAMTKAVNRLDVF